VEREKGQATVNCHTATAQQQSQSRANPPGLHVENARFSPAWHPALQAMGSGFLPSMFNILSHIPLCTAMTVDMHVAGTLQVPG
jgi:hypothetical protein